MEALKKKTEAQIVVEKNGFVSIAGLRMNVLKAKEEVESIIAAKGRVDENTFVYTYMCIHLYYTVLE